MKKEIKNIEASVRARLKKKADDSNRPFHEVFQYYGMERFLYRLCQTEHAEHLILKGALMFTVWRLAESRATADIDFLARFDSRIEKIEGVIKDACRVKVLPDGLAFGPETVKGERIKENADYGGVRVKFIGYLERSQIPMQVDVGFGDVVYPKPKIIDYPVILDFPKPKLKGYPPETVVAEKFEAMVNLGSANSRMKDFYDVWLMMRRFHFSGSNLSEALKRTFEHRKTPIPEGKSLFAEEIYDEKSDRQMLWKAFLKKGDIQHAPERLATVAKDIEGFLNKPLNAVKKKEEFKEEWKASGQWK